MEHVTQIHFILITIIVIDSFNIGYIEYEASSEYSLNFITTVCYQTVEFICLRNEFILTAGEETEPKNDSIYGVFIEFALSNDKIEV